MKEIETKDKQLLKTVLEEFERGKDKKLQFVSSRRVGKSRIVELIKSYYDELPGYRTEVKDGILKVKKV